MNALCKGDDDLTGSRIDRINKKLDDYIQHNIRWFLLHIIIIIRMSLQSLRASPHPNNSNTKAVLPIFELEPATTTNAF